MKCLYTYYQASLCYWITEIVLSCQAFQEAFTSNWQIVGSLSHENECLETSKTFLDIMLHMPCIIWVSALDLILLKLLSFKNTMHPNIFSSIDVLTISFYIFFLMITILIRTVVVSVPLSSDYTSWTRQGNVTQIIFHKCLTILSHKLFISCCSPPAARCKSSKIVKLKLC